MKYLTLSFFLVLLAGCGDAGKEPIKPAPVAGALQVPAFEWRLMSQRELERAFDLYGGRELGHTEKLKGFLGTVGGQYIVFTTVPKFVDDEVTCTLGHEIMHITHGSYHD